MRVIRVDSGTDRSMRVPACFFFVDFINRFVPFCFDSFIFGFFCFLLIGQRRRDASAPMDAGPTEIPRNKNKIHLKKNDQATTRKQMSSYEKGNCKKRKKNNLRNRFYREKQNNIKMKKGSSSGPEPSL